MRRIFLFVLIPIILTLSSCWKPGPINLLSREQTLVQLYDEIDYLEKQIDECRRICYPYGELSYTLSARESARKASNRLRKIRTHHAKRYNDLFASAPDEVRRVLSLQGLPQYIPPHYN